MNYKKLIQSQQVRLKILGFMDFIPDKLMIKIQYRIATGRKLNLKKPKRYTEKIQWYKLNYRDSLMTQCADKYSVREYIKSKGYEEILVPLYGVYDDPEEIDFDSLPEQFVLKTNNGSHTNIICREKSNLNIDDTKKTLKEWLVKRSSKLGREWSYYNIKPQIICEKYLEKDMNDDLIDYKFFCFNGEPYSLHVVVERDSEDGIKLGVFDTNFKKLPYSRSDIPDLRSEVVKPKNFDKMVEISKVLSKDFPHVRVDFYNIDGEIFFGELTFYGGSGYNGYTPDEFDFILGEQFNLPETR